MFNAVENVVHLVGTNEWETIARGLSPEAHELITNTNTLHH